MSEMILITGGARSGKSTFAQKLGESWPAPRVYLATCPAFDADLQARIHRHQAARRDGQWRTVEETLDLAGIIRREKSAGVILVECLTLWINNLLHRAESAGQPFTETDMDHEIATVLDEARRFAGTIIFVTNEVGMGIIPENPLARRFQDLAGWCNQRFAQDANTVVLLACGLPVYLKSTTGLPSGVH